MKLRIRGNSIRLRLSKTEVETFAKNGHVADEIYFGIAPPETLRYTLAKSSVENIKATFRNGEITVFVPPETATKWAETDEVGFEAEQVFSNGTRLRILVEKDFVCITPRENEDESNNYPHPNQAKDC